MRSSSLRDLVASVPACRTVSMADGSSDSLAEVAARFMRSTAASTTASAEAAYCSRSRTAADAARVAGSTSASRSASTSAERRRRSRDRTTVPKPHGRKNSTKAKITVPGSQGPKARDAPPRASGLRTDTGAGNRYPADTTPRIKGIRGTALESAPMPRVLRPSTTAAMTATPSHGRRVINPEAPPNPTATRATSHQERASVTAAAPATRPATRANQSEIRGGMVVMVRG